MGARQEDSQAAAAGSPGEPPAQTHQTTVRVRYGEVDSMGVAYHAHYLVYFEMGRTEYLRSMGASYRAFEDDGFMLVVVDAGLKYERPAHYDDVLVVRTWIGKAAGVRIRFEYGVYRGETRLARGHTTLACTTRAGRPCRVPRGMQRSIDDAVAFQGGRTAERTGA